jgi:hypothetical protein
MALVAGWGWIVAGLSGIGGEAAITNIWICDYQRSFVGDPQIFHETIQTIGIELPN